jgi:hypothetical protein
MNKPPVEHSDWLAQELALSGSGDRRDALLARALRTMPVARSPQGFAADVARLAEKRATLAGDTRFERILQQALFAAMGIGALVAMLVYGDAIWRSSVGVLGSGTMQWILVAAACLMLSWLLAGLQQLPRMLHKTGSP